MPGPAHPGRHWQWPHVEGEFTISAWESQEGTVHGMDVVTIGVVSVDPEHWSTLGILGPDTTLQSLSSVSRM